MSQYPLTVFDSKPVAYWRLNDGENSHISTDVVGDNDFYYENVSFETFGLIFGDRDLNALFDGRSYIYGERPNDLLVSRREQTIEFWVRPDEIKDQAIVAFYLKNNDVNWSQFTLNMWGDISLLEWEEVELSGDAAENNGYTVRLTSDGRLQAVWRIEESYYSAQTSPGAIKTGEVYHVVCVFDENKNVNLYIDGQSFGNQSVNNPSGLSNDTGQFLIGTLDKKSEFFVGALDELSIYNQSFADEWALDHFNTGIKDESIVDDQLPTITSPNGGEFISSRDIIIIWDKPEEENSFGLPITYEVFFTDNYDTHGLCDWHHIASLPHDKNNFIWQYPFSIKSNKCRIGIRCRDHRGFRSSMAISADNFSINNGITHPPVMRMPESNSKYYEYVPVVVSGPERHSRAVYELFYSSKENNIDWTPMFNHLIISNKIQYWDIRHLPAGNDYSVQVRLIDQNNTSNSAFVDNLSLLPTRAYPFYIDTEPPRGDISIENSNGFTTTSDVIVNLSAFDDTTEVDSVRLQEKKLNSEGEFVINQTTEKEDFSNIKTFGLTDEDGVKYVEAILEDIAGNVIPSEDFNNNFRRFFESSDSTKGVISLENGDIWSIFGERTGSLFQNRNLVTSLDGTPTAIAGNDSVIYVAIEDDEGHGILQKFENSEISTINVFGDHDSIINTLVLVGDVLYSGHVNGNVYEFSGGGLNKIKTMSNSVVSLLNYYGNLAIFEDHSSKPTIYNGNQFLDTSITNGS